MNEFEEFEEWFKNQKDIKLISELFSSTPELTACIRHICFDAFKTSKANVLNKLRPSQNKVE